MEKFNDGDIVIDVKHNETFVFRATRDGYAVDNDPERFRLATKEDIEKYPTQTD